MTANAVFLLVTLRAVHGGPTLGPLLGSFLRSLVIAVLAGAAAAGAAGFEGPALVRLAAGGAAFASVAIPGIWVLGDEAMREVPLRLLRRLRGRPRG